MTYLLLLKKEIIINNLYIIIPAICISLYLLYYLFEVNFKHISDGDYPCFYNAGKQVFVNPLRIYDAKGFVYMPNTAFLFFFFALFPYSIGLIIFLFFNYILGLLVLKEYDKILILMELKQKIQRFMFLMIISNGMYVFRQFGWSQTKWLLSFLLLFILRREIQFIKHEKIKDLKFYLINFGLFILAIGLAPFFIFLLLIYIFHDIHIKELFDKENIRKYLIVILMFCAQNFVFIINPSQFFTFISFFNMPNVRNDIFQNLTYLKDFNIIVSSDLMPLLTILFVIAISIISLIIIFQKELLMQEKFGFFFLAYIFLGIYSFQIYLYLLLFSFVLLLFVPFLEKNKKGFEWVKLNKFFIIGILSLTLILNHDLIYYIIPRYSVFILLSLMMISLILLYFKKTV